MQAIQNEKQKHEVRKKTWERTYEGVSILIDPFWTQLGDECPREVSRRPQGSQIQLLVPEVSVHVCLDGLRWNSHKRPLERVWHQPEDVWYRLNGVLCDYVCRANNVTGDISRQPTGYSELLITDVANIFWKRSVGLQWWSVRPHGRYHHGSDHQTHD